MNELMKPALPDLCAELRIRRDGDHAVVNSRDVAEVFEKQHQHVLRDIGNLLHSPNLDDGRVWFRETLSLHPTVAGREDRSFDLTRDGLMLLVMGWTGPKALRLKVRYIEAFNTMEQTLKAQHVGMLQIDKIFAGMMEAHTQAMKVIETTHVSHIALRSDVETIRTDIGQLKTDVHYLKACTKPPRRSITETTRSIHVAAIAAMGGYCPCCGTSMVVAPDGRKMPFSEFDHFYQNSKPDAEHSWLICSPCHRLLTTGNVQRSSREAEFRAYQQKRLRLPGAQPALFA